MSNLQQSQLRSCSGTFNAITSMFGHVIATYRLIIVFKLFISLYLFSYYNYYCIMNCEALNVCRSAVFRMRLTVLLLLFITMMPSDGLNNSNIYQPEINLLSNQSTPWQISWKDTAFNTFISRHILLLDFAPAQLPYWGCYLKVMGFFLTELRNNPSSIEMIPIALWEYAMEEASEKKATCASVKKSS